MDDSIDIAVFRDLLLARERELIEEEKDGDDAAGTVELDQTRLGRLSRMDAMQAQQMAKATSRRRHAERGRIAAALKRIGDGEYGYCLGCGDMIPIPRLEIDPAAAQCVGCAANSEAERY
jgi:DnaK suppressor protein